MVNNCHEVENFLKENTQAGQVVAGQVTGMVTNIKSVREIVEEVVK